MLIQRTAACACLWLLTQIALLAADMPAAPWRAGTAATVITPEFPLPMAGYAARKEPAEGKEQDLFAKALAIADQDGGRAVIVTLDLIGVLDRLRAEVSRRVEQQFQLPPHALLINASHTHCGPAYGNEEAREYFDSLVDKLVDLVGTSLGRLEPATITYSHARCGFAMNRRTPTATGYRNHPNPFGPVDHTVPVLRVATPAGQLRCVLFGYACHNTTMGFRKWLGDYAGYAQAHFEREHPGVSAHFLMGCGGDQNPYPRSKLEYADQHGRALATSIEAALQTNQRVIGGPIRTTLDTVDLEYTTADRPAFPYPIQVIQFGNDLTIVALGSEVVVDYVLRLRAELAQESGPAIWIAGYSNTYAGYIPSQRVLAEGGYEAESRPWKHSLEERIIAKTHELVDRASR
jgi:neutral ceramidase